MGGNWLAPRISPSFQNRLFDGKTYIDSSNSNLVYFLKPFQKQMPLSLHTEQMRSELDDGICGARLRGNWANQVKVLLQSDTIVTTDHGSESWERRHFRRLLIHWVISHMTWGDQRAHVASRLSAVVIARSKQGWKYWYIRCALSIFLRVWRTEERSTIPSYKDFKTHLKTCCVSHSHGVSF